MHRLIATSIHHGQFQLMFTPCQAIGIKPIGDDRFGIHLKEGIVAIYLSPIAFHATEIVGQAELQTPGSPSLLRT